MAGSARGEWTALAPESMEARPERSLEAPESTVESRIPFAMDYVTLPR